MNGAFFASLLGGGGVAPLTQGQVVNFVGIAGSPGFADGTGLSATTNNRSSLGHDVITVDKANGMIYVTNSAYSILRKITPAGVVTTIAGLANNSGSANGTGSVARFSLPDSAAVAANGDILIGAGGNVRVSTPAGVVITEATLPTTAVQQLDGLTPFTGRFRVISGGRIMEMDYSGNMTLVSGNVSTGFVDASGASARWGFSLTGVSYDDISGVAYIVDNANKRIRNANGTPTIIGNGSSGIVNGPVASAQVYDPYGITAYNGVVYFCDLHSVRKIAGGQVTTLAGDPFTSGYVEGVGAAARFLNPRGVAFCPVNNVLYVSDQDGSTIRKVGI